MSCNGCRVLRKACGDTCVLRHCLRCIDSAEAQGHAILFVTKFFGRAGLTGFVNEVREDERPALFQSLLYEACGRTVNPVCGAVGLLFSGKWALCQAAVEAVLKGETPKLMVGNGALQSSVAPVLPDGQAAGLLSVTQPHASAANLPNSTSTYENSLVYLADFSTGSGLSDTLHHSAQTPFPGPNKRTWSSCNQPECADDGLKASILKKPRPASSYSNIGGAHKATRASPLRPSIRSWIEAYKGSCTRSHSNRQAVDYPFPEQAALQVSRRGAEGPPAGKHLQCVTHLFAPVATRVRPLQENHLIDENDPIKGGLDAIPAPSMIEFSSNDGNQKQICNLKEPQTASLRACSRSFNQIIGEPDATLATLNFALKANPSDLRYNHSDRNEYEESKFMHNGIEFEGPPGFLNVSSSCADSELSVNTAIPVGGGDISSSRCQWRGCFNASETVKRNVKLLNLLV